MTQLLGKATIKIDGSMLRSKPGAKLNLGGVTRNTVSDVTGHGYAEQDIAPFIEAEINMDKDTRLESLARITDSSIVFEADTGQTYILRHAWIENPPEATDGDGGAIPLRFVGQTAEEMV